jgi:hypothetical protein
MKQESEWERAQRESEEWLPRLEAAIGSRLGTHEQRKALANELLKVLDSVVAFNVIFGAERVNSRMYKQVDDILRAFLKFREKVEACHFGSRILDRRANLDEEEAHLRRLLWLYSYPLGNRPRIKRGPQNDLEVLAARQIALTYHRHLDRWPSSGRWGRDRRTTPYHKICDVAERFLQSRGVTKVVKGREFPFEIPDPSRKQGLASAIAAESG